MRKYDDDQSYQPNGAWEAEDSESYTDNTYETYATDYDDDYDDYNLDEELDSEHNFRIAMNVFDLISILVGLAIILVLAGLLFSLFNWVQRDLSQSLSVITAPFQ